MSAELKSLTALAQIVPAMKDIMEARPSVLTDGMLDHRKLWNWAIRESEIRRLSAREQAFIAFFMHMLQPNSMSWGGIGSFSLPDLIANSTREDMAAITHYLWVRLT